MYGQQPGGPISVRIERDESISFVILTACVLAAGLLALGGLNLYNGAAQMEIRSVGGQTIDEAYYQAWSVFGRGVAFAAWGLAIYVLAVPFRR